MSVATLASSSTNSDASPIPGLIIIGVIVAVVIAVKRSNKQKAAQRLSAREVSVKDKLTTEGTPPTAVMKVKQGHQVMKGGKTKTTWHPCVLALTDSQLIRFGLTDGDRWTLHLADIAGSSISRAAMSVAMSNGHNVWFVPADSDDDGATRLQNFEADLSRTVGRLKQSRHGGHSSVADELARLAELRRDGIIDDADWSRAKDLFLGKQEDERDRSARELRQLHELRRAGVLSESEFNMKKWDVLSRSNS